MAVQVRTRLAQLRACLYDGHCHPLLRLRDGTHPLAARTCETPASSPGQADQTGSAGGCQRLGPGRQIVIKTARERRRPIRRSGRDPVPDPTPTPAQSGGSRAGALSTSSLPTRRACVMCCPYHSHRADHWVMCSRGGRDGPVDGAWSPRPEGDHQTARHRGARRVYGRVAPRDTCGRLVVSWAWTGGNGCDRERVSKSSRRWPARK